MIKNLEENATYEPSKRSSNWFKLKKDYINSGQLSDSLDLVVVGADWGRGKRTGLFGSFLLASFDAESNKFQTVTKVATGFTDQMLSEVTTQLKPLTLENPPEDLHFKD